MSAIRFGTIRYAGNGWGLEALCQQIVKGLYCCDKIVQLEGDFEYANTYPKKIL